MTSTSGFAENAGGHFGASTELNGLNGDEVTLETLKSAKVLRRDMKRARIMLSGELQRAVNVKDANIAVTKGAKTAIEAAGGSVA